MEFRIVQIMQTCQNWTEQHRNVSAMHFSDNYKAELRYFRSE